MTVDKTIKDMEQYVERLMTLKLKLNDWPTFQNAAKEMTNLIGSLEKFISDLRQSKAFIGFSMLMVERLIKNVTSGITGILKTGINFTKTPIKHEKKNLTVKTPKASGSKIKNDEAKKRKSTAIEQKEEPTKKKKLMAVKVDEMEDRMNKMEERLQTKLEVNKKSVQNSISRAKRGFGEKGRGTGEQNQQH